MRQMLPLLVILMGTVPEILTGYPDSNSCCENNNNNNKQHYYYYTPPPPKQYPFLPAPPGKTPPCAKGGATFCPKIETYPTQLIRYLLYKWGRTYGPFIVSETDTPFLPPKEPEVEPVYGGYDYPPGTPYEAPEGYYDTNNNNNNHHHNNQNNNNNYNYTDYSSPSSSSNQFQLFKPSQPQQRGLPFQPSSSSSFQPQTTVDAHQAAAAAVPLVTSYWWNHRNNNNQAAFPHVTDHRLRTKRQAPSGGQAEQLCPSRSQYYTPQAAMNRDGNWMYVVNMEGDSRYVQQVKTETCINAGGACSNICSPAPGFRSTCRQVMVQKRLVALAGSGDRLMSDVFWFPSCCVCDIVRA